MSDIKERIKEIRKYNGESQDLFSSKLNLSRTFVCLLENGDREPSDRTLSDICRVYQVNESWLRTGEGEMLRPLDREGEIAKITNTMLDEEEPSIKNALIKLVSEASEDDLKLLLEYAKKFASEVEERTPTE